MDDRNARSWWVPNEPSPKAPNKASPGVTKQPTTTTSATPSAPHTRVPRSPSSPARKSNNSTTNSPAPVPVTTPSPIDPAWQSVLDRLEELVDEASSLCAKSTPVVIEGRIKDISETFRKGVVRLENIAAEVAAQVARKEKEASNKKSFTLRAVAKPFEPAAIQFPVAPALSWFIPLTADGAPAIVTTTAPAPDPIDQKTSAPSVAPQSTVSASSIEKTIDPAKSKDTQKTAEAPRHKERSNAGEAVPPAPAKSYVAHGVAKKGSTVKPELDEMDEDTVAFEVAKATDVVWAEAEAWIEAEARAEDKAWKDMGLSFSASRGRSKDTTPTSSTTGGGGVEGRRGRSVGSLQLRLDSSELSRDKSLSLATPDNETGGTYITPRQSPVLHQLSIDDIGGDPSRPSASSPSSNHSTKGGAVLSFDFQSPSGSSPQRSLHDKLSSPERRRRTPAEAFQKLNERLQAAQSNRDRSVTEIREKAQVQISRVREVEQRAAARIIQAGQTYAEKLRDAEQRHEQHIRNIKEKANNENNKVSEVLFINSFNELMLKDQLQERLTEVENRILAASQRRELRLQDIQDKSRKRYHRKAQQMSEMRLSIEKEKMERWENLQKRLQTVQERRQARLEELQRRNKAQENVDEVSTLAEPSIIDIPPAENRDDLVLELEKKTPSLQVEDAAPAILPTEPLKIASKPGKLASQSDIDHDIDLLCAPLEDVKFQRRRRNFNILQTTLLDLVSKEIRTDNSSKSVSISEFLQTMSGLQQHLSLVLGEYSSSDNRYFSRIHHYLREIEKRPGSSIGAGGKDVDVEVSEHNPSSNKSKKRNKKKREFAVNVDSSTAGGAGNSIATLYATFIPDTIDFFKRHLKIRDQSLFARQQFGLSNIMDAPDEKSVLSFKESGGLTICSLVLDASFGGLCNGESLMRSLGYEDASGDGFESGAPALHYVVTSLDWCVAREVASYEELTESGENILSKLCFLLKVLLNAFEAWDSEVPEKASNTASDGRGSVGTKKSSNSSNEVSGTHYPEYVAMAMPIVSVLTRLLKKTAIASESASFQNLTSNLTNTGILSLANSALERLHKYCDVTRGCPTYFLTLAYQLMDFTSQFTKKDESLSSILAQDFVSFSVSDDRCLTSNLMHLLAALVLSDSSSARSNPRTGDAADSSPAVIPRQMLCTALKAVELLDQLGAFDINLVQKCPQIVKVSLTHSISVLISNLFQVLEDKSLWSKPEPKGKGKLLSSGGPAAKSKSKASKGAQVISYAELAPWCPDWVGPKEADAALSHIFSLITRFCLGSPENQDAVACGASPSLLLRLCRLPMRYFTDERLRNQLFPALVTACANHPENLRIVRSEMSTSVLVDYLSKMILKDSKDTSSLAPSRGTPKPAAPQTTDPAIAALLESFSGAQQHNAAVSAASSSVDYVADLKSKIPRACWDDLTKQLEM